jgi:hypothetical protein
MKMSARIARFVIAGVASVGAAGAVLVAAAPASAASPHATTSAVTPAAQTTGIQVEAVSSATPVMVSDLAGTESVGIMSTLFCAVRDNTFGCQQGTPGDGLVVARLYYEGSYGGSQVVIFNPAYQVGCTGGTGDNEGGANLGAATNLISSVHTYNSCDVKLFDGDNATGTATGWLDQASSLGSMNNRANSFKIS